MRPCTSVARPRAITCRGFSPNSASRPVSRPPVSPTLRACHWTPPRRNRARRRARMGHLPDGVGHSDTYGRLETGAGFGVRRRRRSLLTTRGAERLAASRREGGGQMRSIVRPRHARSRHGTRRRGLVAALVAAAIFVTSVGGIEASGSPPQAAADPKVISDWNAVAFDTIIVDAGKMNAEAFMWFAFEQAAVYNAVVGITRRYELYNWNTRGPRGASPQAAAAVAAHDVLLEYFPASQARLDTSVGGVARRDSRWHGEDAGHPLWRARSRPAHRAACGRRPLRAGHVRCPACGRGLAADSAGVCAVLRPVDGADAAVAARVAEPVPSGSASSVDLPDIHGGLQRGEGGGFGNKHGPDTRTDRHRAVHRREHLLARQLVAA